MRLTHRQDCG